MTDEKKSKFELWVELVKASAWPLIALFVLFSFWNPLRLTARQLSQLVGRSESITIAGLSLKIREGLPRQASPEVSDALAGLTAEGVGQLVDFASLSCWDDADSAENARRGYGELLELGLLEEVPSEEACDSNNGRYFLLSLRPPELGHEAREFLLSVIREFVEELARAEVA